MSSSGRRVLRCDSSSTLSVDASRPGNLANVSASGGRTLAPLRYVIGHISGWNCMVWESVQALTVDSGANGGDADSHAYARGALPTPAALCSYGS
ncbi:hypothetical protein MRB53_037386 [Persea americana]|nr:hypothetical protein MRB53_037386 [Persea americana]